MNLSENAIQVLEKRYLKKDETGKPLESPREMFWRVAKTSPSWILCITLRFIPGLPGDRRRWRAWQVLPNKPEVAVDLEFSVSEWDWATMKMAHARLESKGLTKSQLGWSFKNWSKRGRMKSASWRFRFYKVMTEARFPLNSPALINAGRELQQLSACFVLPIEDSMVSIFDSLKHAALIHQSGGGTDFEAQPSKAQERCRQVHGRRGVGPVSFMKVFNAATGGGQTRRSKARGEYGGSFASTILTSLSSSPARPITTNSRISNISVGITERFMEAVEKDEGVRAVVNPGTER